MRGSSKWNKTALTAASVALVGLSLSACGSNNGDSSGPAASGGSASTGSAEPVVIKVAKGTGGYPYIEGLSDINKDKYMTELEKAAGVDLDVELIPHADFDQKLQLIFAGGNLPDLIETKGINTSQVEPAVAAGALLPLNDLIDRYAPNMKKALTEEEWKFGTISKDGVIYGIPTLEAAPHGFVSFIRKDWLDKLGLPVPQTLDEYVTTLRAFRDNDPNGNGKADEIPYTARKEFKSGDIFFGAFGVNPDGWTLADGKLTPNQILPQMKDALAFYKMLYDEKLFDAEAFVQEGKDWDAKIRGKNVVGFWQHSATEAELWASETKKNVPEAVVVPVAAPVGPDGKSGGLIRSTIADKAWVIPKTAKNPEAILKFLDFFFTEEGKKFTTYGIEGDNYTVSGDSIEYKSPSTADEIQEEMARQEWYQFTGQNYLTNEEFMKNKPNNELVVQALEISAKEGVVNDGAGMPALPTLQSRPELGFKGLWLEFAAKVITGKESIDNFDKFVADWKSRGGEKLIEEATAWYNASH
ncbi:extracellular solute-binding protein [Cohnella fermenti]|nr:extracellular solute-binding protein [Cohnella fermenti]